jgi:ABC-type phosphate/phosphonate transport system substrate-binding protein
MSLPSTGSAATRSCSACVMSRRLRTVFVTRRGEAFVELGELAEVRVALGSRDSGHAAILPSRLRQAGRCRALRFDTDLGKHGDTGDSEIRVVEAVTRGDADAGAIGDATWPRCESRSPCSGRSEIAWRSRATTTATSLHSRPSTRPGRRRSEALLAMSYDDPTLRPAMDLEA